MNKLSKTEEPQQWIWSYNFKLGVKALELWFIKD